MSTQQLDDGWIEIGQTVAAAFGNVLVNFDPWNGKVTFVEINGDAIVWTRLARGKRMTIERSHALVLDSIIEGADASKIIDEVRFRGDELTIARRWMAWYDENRGSLGIAIKSFPISYEDFAFARDMFK